MLRSAHYVTALGLLIAVSGLGLDGWLHNRNNTTLADEALFSIQNPGHLVFGIGLAITLAGVVLGLLHAAEGSSSRSRLRDGALAGLLLAVTSGVLAFGFVTAGDHHPHGEVAGADTHHDDSALTGLSHEDRFLVEGSRHEEDEDHGPQLLMNSADILKLAGEVEVARRAGERYKSIDTALAEGYVQVTQDLPLIGAHFLHPRYSNDGRFDLDHPEMIIYTYRNGAWQLYGLSYLSRPVSRQSEKAPEGFTGPYDTWHAHDRWCFTLTGARAVGPDECGKIQGVFVERTGYMVHFWLVDNPRGVFSHNHPELVGSAEYIVPDVSAILDQFRPRR